MTEPTPDQLRKEQVGVIFTRLCATLSKELKAKNVPPAVIKEARQFCKDFVCYLTVDQVKAQRVDRETRAVTQGAVHPFPTSDTA